jgi:hypothetical protein
MTRIQILMLATVLFVRTSTTLAQCCGDCNGDGRVTIGELVHAVTLALGTCPSTAGPQITLTGVRLSTFSASLDRDVTEAEISITMDTDWAGNDGSGRAFLSISEPSTFPNRIELVKNGDFLRWVVAESSGIEDDMSVNIGQWQPGTHTVTVSFGAGSAAITVDGYGATAPVGGVVLTAGSSFVLGPTPGSGFAGEGTTFRSVLFTSGVAP